jgi:hypothetical protein
MPTHIPRALPTKKLEILAKREQHLQKLLALNDDDKQISQTDAIVKACESLRIAKLGIIKSPLAKRDQNAGLDKPLKNQKELADAKQYWTTLPTNAIIALYQAGE